MTFAELKQLQDGWLDGHGKAPPLAGVEWLEKTWSERYSADLPGPMFFPLPNGHVVAEWQIHPFTATLDIDTEGRKAVLHHVCDTKGGGAELTITFDLAESNGWSSLCRYVPMVHRLRNSLPAADKGVA